MINLDDPTIQKYRQPSDLLQNMEYIIHGGLVSRAKSIQDLKQLIESDGPNVFIIPSKDGSNMYRVIASPGTSMKEKSDFFKKNNPELAKQYIKEAGYDERFLNYITLAQSKDEIDYGWEHVSISVLDRYGNPIDRCPTWNEMREIHKMFFSKGENSIQFHPRKSEYVNDYPYALHMWRHPDYGIPEPVMDSSTQEQSTLTLNGHNYKIRLSKDTDWTRVNFQLVGEQRFPIWEEMCDIKHHFFDPEEVAFSFTMPEEFEKEGNTTIDIWHSKEKILTPHPDLVGSKIDR